jgi:hypothetical protein
MRQNSLLFAGLALEHSEYIELWKRLPPDSTVDEVIRNFFIRQPVLWVLGQFAFREGERGNSGTGETRHLSHTAALARCQNELRNLEPF